MSEAGSSADLTGFTRWTTFASVTIAAAVYGAAWTIPNAVLPQMQGDLSVGLEQISWVVTATVVASAIGIPPTAWLTQRLGAKRLMLCALGAFTLTSALVGTASSLEEVVLWRIASALAGAPIIALSQSVILNTFPRRQHGMALAFWMVGMASGWVLAPAVGAYLADLESWRLTFFSVAPFGAVALLACSVFMSARPRCEGRRFDWFGFFALSVGLAAVQIVLNQGQQLDWFDSRHIVGWGIAAVAALYIYIAHNITSRNSFLDWSVFRDRNYCLGIAMIAVHAYIGLAPLVLIPTMLEKLRGLEVLTIGVLIVPRGLAQMLATLVAGPLVNRMDPRIMLVCGLLTFAASSWVMAHYNLDIGAWDIIWPTVVQGVALGFIVTAILAVTYSTLPSHKQASATTLFSLTYSLASSVGVALSVAVLSRSVQVNHEELAAHVVPSSEALRHGAYADEWDLYELEGLAAIDSEITQQAYMIGYTNVFWGLMVSALLIIPLVLFIRRAR